MFHKIGMYFSFPALTALVILFQNPANAAFTYPGCADVVDADFKLVPLAINSNDPDIGETMKMAFDMDAAGNVDVYFVQRSGEVKRYNGAAKTTETLGYLPIAHTAFTSQNEEGLTGIALDPGFKTNHQIFLYYTNDASFILSRFVLTAEKLDMTSEKILLTIPQHKGTPHTSGAMQFDAAGDLWLAVGDDGQGMPAANTNDLLGKILRIHPTAEGGYTIPAGNLYPSGTAKTRPEVYVMGTRNPYTITLDTLRKGLTWGDIGPDQTWDTEEDNFTTKPGFFGWPMYSGNQIVEAGATNAPAPMPTAGLGTIASPVNNFTGNTGLMNLPAATPAIYPYHRACAVTGPVYYYNPNLKSKVKMPPHFDGVWFVGEFNAGWFKAHTLDAAGSKILSTQDVFTGVNWGSHRILDFQVGPDGAFYINNYNGWKTVSAQTGIYRLEYNQKCDAPNFKRTWTTGIANKPIASGFKVLGNTASFTLSGSHTLLLQDLEGRVLARHSGSGAATYDLSHQVRSGIYLVTSITDAGTVTNKIFIH